MSPASSTTSGSDRDDALDEDIEALRRACVISGQIPSADARGGSFYDSDSGDDSSGTDDIGLLHRLQEQFLLPSSSPRSLAVESSSLVVKPSRTRPPSDSDDDDDFEILNVIKRSFAQYENDAIKKRSENCLEADEMVLADVRSGRGTPDTLSKDSDPCSSEPHQSKNETCDISRKTFLFNHFPKSAHNFLDALKKNRSCQKFIRWKLIEIEAHIEENKDLRERIKCLVDFQVASKRKVGRAFCQQKDPCIRLISTQKSRMLKNPKNKWKKFPALYFGPTENSHVSRYKMVMKRFPISLHKKNWSNTEKENLVKGLKQQYQEIMVLNSMNSESDYEGSLIPYLSSSDLEVTPEKIRSFLPLVDWDRLASMYLAGRSGAECESRWLNCEDPLINQNPWTVMEDKKLLCIVQEKGVCNWIDIAVALGTHRTPFQSLVRYQRSLNPLILNKDWTQEEDDKLRAAVDIKGLSNWQVVASCVKYRAGTQCSNRWKKCLIPERKKVGRWSVDEDKRLKVAVMLFGAKNWNKIARFAPGRTQAQCRERWLNCLDPSLNLEPWTEEEDRKLLAAITEHGHYWSKVATCVPPRTDNQCMRRWKIVLPHEVPLLQAAKKMRKAVFQSNFVDREKERPLIGPDDFSSLILPSSTEDGNSTIVKKGRSSNKPVKKPKSNAKRSVGENLPENGMADSSDIHPAENRRKRIPRKKTTSNKPVKMPESNAKRSVGENLIENGMADSSDIHPVENRKKRIPRKKTTSNDLPKNPRAKSRRPLEDNVTAISIVNPTSEIGSDALSLVRINSCTAENGSLKRMRKKTPSNNVPKRSKVKSRSSLGESLAADAVISTSSDIVPPDLSIVPFINPTNENIIMKRTRKKTLSNNVPKRSKVKSRSSLGESLAADAVISTSSDIVTPDLSIVPFINPTNENIIMKRTRKKTPSDNRPKKSRAKSRRSHEENLGANVIQASAEVAQDGLSLIPTNSPPAENGSMKRIRKRVSSSGSTKQLQSNPRCKINHRIENKAAEVNHDTSESAFPYDSFEATVEPSVVGHSSKKRSRSQMSREMTMTTNQQLKSCIDSGLICPKPRAKRKTRARECSTTAAIMEDHAVSDGAPTALFITSNDIECRVTLDGNESLPDTTAHNEAKKTRECLDDEVIAYDAENASENNAIRSDEPHESPIHMDPKCTLQGVSFAYASSIVEH